MGIPEHPFNSGVTFILAVRGVVPLLMAVKTGTLPFPDADKPTEVLSFVQENEVPGVELVKFTADNVDPLHVILFAGTITLGLSVNVIVRGKVAFTFERLF